MIPAREHQQVKQLLLAEGPGQQAPEVFADIGGVMQSIGGLDEQPVPLITPAGIGRVAMGQGSDLLAGQAARPAKNAMCTPHSYSHRHLAHVRSMMISRWRSESESRLLSS